MSTVHHCRQRAGTCRADLLRRRDHLNHRRSQVFSSCELQPLGCSAPATSHLFVGGLVESNSSARHVIPRRANSCCKRSCSRAIRSITSRTPRTRPIARTRPSASRWRIGPLSVITPFEATTSTACECDTRRPSLARTRSTRTSSSTGSCRMRLRSDAAVPYARCRASRRVLPNARLVRPAACATVSRMRARRSLEPDRGSR